MIHVAQKLYLPQRPLRINLVVEGIRNLLDSHVLAGLRIQSRTEMTKNIKKQTNIKPIADFKKGT